MKKHFFIILGLLFLACDDSDDEKGITDMQGLAVDLSWDEASVRLKFIRLWTKRISSLKSKK